MTALYERVEERKAVFIGVESHAELKKLAEQEHRSMKEEVEYLISQRLKELLAQ